MRSLGRNGERELRGKPANPGSPGNIFAEWRTENARLENVHIHIHTFRFNGIFQVNLG